LKLRSTFMIEARMQQNRPFRVISLTEQMLGSICGFLATVSSNPTPVGGAVRASDTGLSMQDRRVSEGLMRVNHVGEVCAQALYESQSVFAKSEDTRGWMKAAGAEEKKHLEWTSARLNELGGRVSYLNPVWYAGSFALGAAAALISDKASLSFVLETERQVEAHLAGHLETLPEADNVSRLIVEKMRSDEQRHADLALQDGAEPLPMPVQVAMKLSAKLMTQTAYYI
jgi:3-demethoxyubiquinol 3-hydroxylase